MQHSNVAAPGRAAPAQRPVAREPRVTKPAAGGQTRLPASKTAARGERTAKRPANEALSTVRKFGEHLPEIPTDSYAADGSRRKIVIRPTSIQDVYYYSAPR